MYSRWAFIVKFMTAYNNVHNLLLLLLLLLFHYIIFYREISTNSDYWYLGCANYVSSCISNYSAASSFKGIKRTESWRTNCWGVFWCKGVRSKRRMEKIGSWKPSWIVLSYKGEQFQTIRWARHIACMELRKTHFSLKIRREKITKENLCRWEQILQ